MLWLKILEVILLCVYLGLNVLTSNVMSAKKMKEKFINGQCLTGKIFTNLFYAPAWLLKGIKYIILFIVA